MSFRWSSSLYWNSDEIIFSNIRFPLISPDELDEKVQSVSYMKEFCMDLLFEASKYHMLLNKQPLLQSPRTRVRGHGSCLLALGGKGSFFKNKRSVLS